MKVVRDLSHWRGIRRPLCVAVGFFDGVHRGHARLIARAVRRARAVGGEAWVLTFDPHPLRVLHPAAAPRLLTSLPHKLRAIAQLGADGATVLPFTRALARHDPQNFLKALHGGAPTLSHVFVGPNWRFGCSRAGTVATLARFARAHGFRVTVVPPAKRGGAVISSTRIREALARGNLGRMAAMLGRPFSVTGTVVRGRRLGRKLGYPTANLAPTGEALPPYGIYAAIARIGRRLRPGVVSYGVRPTLNPTANTRAVIELHVFDYAGNLYGRSVEIFFLRRLRDEKKFPSLAALSAQIARDTRSARRIVRTSKMSQRIPLHSTEPRIIVPPEQYKQRQKKTGKARR